MERVSRIYKPLHQRFSELDNAVVSAFCDSYNSINWIADFKDGIDDYCGIDLQLTANTKSKAQTYDVEIKSRVSITNFSIVKDCFFEADKWLSLVRYDNDKKLYIAIYPNCDKIAIWNVNSELLRKSEKDLVEMKKNTCNGTYTKTKQVYKFKLEDAKVFDYNLTPYKNKYNALYSEITKKKAQTMGQQ